MCGSHGPRFTHTEKGRDARPLQLRTKSTGGASAGLHVAGAWLVHHGAFQTHTIEEGTCGKPR